MVIYTDRFKQKKIEDKLKKLKPMTVAQLQDLRARLKFGLYEKRDFSPKDIKLIDEVILDKAYEKV